MIFVIGIPLLLLARFRFFGEEGYRAPGSNVIFISIDTLRADHLGSYGYERETSPNIDSFARENIQFMNHSVTMTTTIPSHTSMFTGLHPRSHGVLSNYFKLGLYPETLSEILKGEGYLTAGFVSAMAMHSLTGISRGFDHYSNVDKLSTEAAHLYERLLPWLEDNRKEKLFLFLHFFDPHNKYEPPPDYRKWGEKRTDLYDGEILYVDHYIGQVFDLLKRLDLYNDSLIILTSDHGESLGERNYWSHARPLYDNCLRVPLIIHLPEKFDADPARVDLLTSGVDFFPTILRFLDIRGDHLSEGLDIFGEDIHRREFVFAQRQRYAKQDDPKTREIPAWKDFEYGDKYVARSKDWKYVLRTRYEDELYNLAADPQEEDNLLAGEGAEEYDTGKYKEAISRWLEASPEKTDNAQTTKKEILDKLRALGYVN